MKLDLIRVDKQPNYTVGYLWIDDVRVATTCEDTDRGLRSDMSIEEIKAIKVPDKTAIPTGEYEVVLNVKSPKFSQKPYYANFCDGYLPRLLNVKGYDGVLLHVGVDENWTSGCILVGESHNENKLIGSQSVFESIYKQLKAAWDSGDKITIKIQ